MLKFVTLIGLLASTALAETTTTIKGDNTEGFVSNRNLVFNANFELTSTTSGAGWALSSGTYSISGTSPLRGSRSAVWDATAASQVLSSKLVAIPAGMQGIGGVASCQIKVASGVATHTLRVTDGTNVLGQIPVVSSSIATVTSVPFMFPTSGSIDLEIVSNADEPSIQIDDCYLGVNPIEKVAQATMYAFATMNAGASCTFGESTSTGISNYVDFNNTSTTCGSWSTSGNISVTTNDYRPTINNMPPGEYEIVMSGRYNNSVAGSSSLRLSDGTNLSSPVSIYNPAGDLGVPVTVFRMRYETAGNRTFKLQCSDTFVGTCGIALSSVDAYLTWTFKRFPLQSEQVVRADVLQGQWGSRYFPDGTASFTTTSATYVNVTAANLFAATTNKGAAVACTDANAICLRMPQMQPGAYKIDYTGPIGINGTGSTCQFAINDGSVDYEISGLYQGSSGNGISGSTVLIYNSVQTNKEFQFRVKRNTGTGSCDIVTTFNLGHNLTITPLSQQLPVPVFVGSVTSQSSGVERIERLHVSPACTSSPCTLAYGSPGVTSVTRSSAGTYTANFTSGTFANTPTCSMTPGAGAAIVGGRLGTKTASSIQFFIFNSSGTATDASFDLVCIGERP